MPGKSLHLFCLIAALVCPAFSWPAERKTAAVFPFPVEVDKAKGKTGIYPNRVRDRHTGIWYVMVSGGKYRIGDAKHPDSKPIEVTLSAFYISEAQVTYAQMAAHLQRDFQDRVKQTESDLRKEATPLEARDARLVAEFVTALFVHEEWPDDLGRLAQVMKAQLDTLPEGDGMEKGALTPKEREVLKSVAKAFKDSLATMRAKGDRAYRTAHYTQAEAFAKGCGVTLPTEAQWEVAARLHEAGKVGLEGLFDDVLEWCSDYYAYDYFRRKGDFRDPRGPRRSRLTKDQVAREESPASGSGSGLFGATPWRVLRGVGATTRLYGRAEGPAFFWGWRDSFRRPKGIRLVCSPRHP